VAREVEEEEKLVGAVVGDIRSLNLQGLAPPRAKPLDQAVVSRLGIDKKALMVSGGAGFGTLALVLLAVGLWEFNQRRVTSVGEVVHGFHLDLVGTLPPMRGPLRRGPGPRGVSKAYTRWTAYIDAYRMLLLRAVGPTGARVLLVTSAVPGEGKTSLSSHLALSLARSGKRVLLVDGDLRKPTLHRLFDVAAAPGLAEAICGGLPVREAVRPSVQPGLWVLPAGQLTADAIDALARGTTRELFRELAEDYDLVVVDSAPVLPVADTLSLAEHADAVLFSLMHGVSRMPKVSAAIHRLQRIGTPVVGAVVHGTDEDVHGEAYYTPEIPEA
jgi:polysaccharide biosynthesis transport protein